MCLCAIQVAQTGFRMNTVNPLSSLAVLNLAYSNRSLILSAFTIHFYPHPWIDNVLYKVKLDSFKTLIRQATN